MVKKLLFFVLLGLSFTGYHVVFSNNRQDCIYLDAGHGGLDGGADVDDGNGVVKEKDIALPIVLYLRDYFINAGLVVHLTRDGDYDLASDPHNRKRSDIHKRVQLINESPCRMYLSVHLNSYNNSALRGAQTFYGRHNPQNEILATLIQDSLQAILQNTIRKAKKIDNIYLVDNVKKTGCLIEAGFLTNPEELKKLQSSYYQSQVAYAIYIGAMHYLNL